MTPETSKNRFLNYLCLSSVLKGFLDDIKKVNDINKANDSSKKDWIEIWNSLCLYIEILKSAFRLGDIERRMEIGRNRIINGRMCNIDAQEFIGKRIDELNEEKYVYCILDIAFWIIVISLTFAIFIDKHFFFFGILLIIISNFKTLSSVYCFYKHYKEHIRCGSCTDKEKSKKQG